MNENYGIVYVLTNQYMPGLVKIGETTRDSVRERMRNLHSTGVPVPFECAFACKVDESRVRELEKAIHNYLDGYRVSKNREFFEIEVGKACELLTLICNFSECEDATEEVQNIIYQNMEDGDEEALKRAKRPKLDYIKVGLHIGDTLSFARDPETTCTIDTNYTVSYGGKHSQSLTAITRDLIGYTVRPAFYWKTQDGKLLSEIYDAIYE